ncbi:MAG: TrmH family RNA methyltransferase [Synechococcaceae cyanobacterium]
MRQLRELREPRGRREQRLLLVEGTHLLQEVLRLDLTPRLVLATSRWCSNHPSLLTALSASVPFRLASEEVLAAVASTDHPDGVLLTLPLPEPQVAAPAEFLLVLDRVQDPGNLGTLLRTALAAGVDQVWLAEGADPWQPKVLRASSGAALALPLRRFQLEPLRQRLELVGAQGLQRLAAVLPRPGLSVRPYWQLDWTRPTALLLGNEANGLDPALLRLADALVTIPHASAVESLNVAVAAAPLLLERWRQRSQPSC